jgi:hypothetical protein
MLKDSMAMRGIAAISLAVVTISALGCCQRKDEGLGLSNSPAMNSAGMPQEKEHQQQPNKEGNIPNLTKQAAEAIAIKEVLTRTRLKARQLEADSELKGNVWRVLVCLVPPTPGSFWFVTVGHDGTIKDYTGGE